MDLIEEVWAAPEMYWFRWVLGSYVALYVIVFVVSQIMMAIRGEGKTPLIDRIVHVSTMVGLVLITILPVFVIVTKYNQKDYSSFWYLAPYAIVSLVNLITALKLGTKPNPKLN